MLKISEEVKEKIEKYSREVYAGVGPGEKGYEDFLSASLSDANAQTQIKWLEDNLGVNKDRVVLDYGAGSGLLTVTGNLLGYNFSGFEIDERLYEIGRLLCEDNHVDSGKMGFSSDGTLFFAEDTFDVVSSFFVYEHVTDTNRYLEQGLRVLKKGGKFLIFTCNYQLMFEFHYGLFLPLFSKLLTKFILTALGRNTKFIDGVNKVTPKKFLGDIEKLHRSDFRVENVGSTEFLNNLSNEKQHGGLFIKVAGLLKKLGMIKFLTGLGFYNPLIYVITKN